MPGVKPLTIVETSVGTTLEEMAGRVVQTMADHGPLLQQYHSVWYNAPHTWQFLHFLGVGMMKAPNDLWMYQELISAHRPRVIIETGTYQGGSALWFAFLQEMLGIEGGRVFTVDFEDHRRCQHPRITFLGGDSRDPAVRDAIADEVAQVEATYGAGPRLISLDADHSADHVRRELELYAPLAQVGDYLVVEDTNISWGGPEGDRGARGGVEDYIAQHQGEFIQDPLCERWLLTMHPGGWLRRVAECQHG
jgi:cephalosporin hydroxylase